MPESLQVNSTWYEASGQYVGPGSVLAYGQQKLLEGTFTVSWNALGACNITCAPDNLDLKDAMRIIDEGDRFSNLRVETPGGTFISPKVHFNGITFGVDPSEIRFTTLRGIYMTENRVDPTYWNVPLINLLSEFRASQPSFAHPLRMNSPEVADDQFESDLARLWRQSEASRLCLFEFESKPAFVERLLAYEEAKTRLKSKTSQYEATCMMVGSVPDSAKKDLDGVLEWFPAQAITAMSLASGTSVGMGFIELRDTTTRLHSRVHASFRREPYAEESTVIGEMEHGGLGAVVEAFIKAKRDALTRANRLAVDIRTSKAELATPDRAFATIVRTLDGIATGLELNRRNLLLEVPAHTRNTIKSVLIDAREKLYAIASQVSDDGGTAPEIATVRRIASKLENADATENSFGLTLPRLLKHYGLNDEQAIAECYAVRPRSDSLSWPEVLNKYRGQVIHEGCIDYQQGISVSDVFSITKHLIDVATRICLTEVGYCGTYNPDNLTFMQDCRLDYFQNARDAKLFGIDGTSPRVIAGL